MALSHMHSVENVPEILIFSQAGNIPNNIPFPYLATKYWFLISGQPLDHGG